MPITISSCARASTMALVLALAPGASASGQAEPGPAADGGSMHGSIEAARPVAPAILQAAPVAAAAQIQAEELGEIDRRTAALRPGEFIWQPERAPQGRVEMVVSLAEQKAYVYRAGVLMAVTTVSTGRAGHRTPTGSFEILQKSRRHFSNLYNNAPMPNMQRLTWGGIALHAGQLPGYPASHGCVRLPLHFSRLLFGITSLGQRVHIVAGAPPSPSTALAYATSRTARGMELASDR